MPVRTARVAVTDIVVECAVFPAFRNLCVQPRDIESVSAHIVIVVTKVAMSCGIERRIQMLHIIMEIEYPRQIIVIPSPDTLRKVRRIRPSALTVHIVKIQIIEIFNIIIGNPEIRFVPELCPCAAVRCKKCIFSCADGIVERTVTGNFCVFCRFPGLYRPIQRDVVFVFSRHQPEALVAVFTLGKPRCGIAEHGKSNAEFRGVQLLRDVHPMLIHNRFCAVKTKRRRFFLLSVPFPKRSAAPAGKTDFRRFPFFGGQMQMHNGRMCLGGRKDTGIDRPKRRIRMQPRMCIGKCQPCMICLLVHIVKQRAVKTHGDLPRMLLHGVTFLPAGRIANIIVCGIRKCILPQVCLTDVNMNPVVLHPDKGAGISVTKRQSCPRLVQRCSEIQIVSRQQIGGFLYRTF